MRIRDRARFVALTVLAAVAGLASVGIAALAHNGVCVHRLAESKLAAASMPGMVMDGMPMPDAVMSGPCPILIGAALVAGAFCVLALIALAVARPSGADVAVTSARLLLGMRFAPLAALLCAAGALPLALAIAVDGNFSGAAPLLAAAILVAGAAAAALALLGVARLIMAFARRLIDALAAAFRLLVPGADSPWLLHRTPLPVPAGVRLARRRSSRAPPLRY